MIMMCTQSYIKARKKKKLLNGYTPCHLFRAINPNLVENGLNIFNNRKEQKYNDN